MHRIAVRSPFFGTLNLLLDRIGRSAIAVRIDESPARLAVRHWPCRRSRPKARGLPDLDRAQMSRSPIVVRTVPALRRAVDSLSAKTATTALVPTMGALARKPCAGAMEKPG